MEYHFDDPADDSDSADIPKTAFVRKHTYPGFPLPFIFGSGFYTRTGPADTMTQFVPVVLDSMGKRTSHFTSELALTNRGADTAMLNFTYTAEAGGGSGTATDMLGPHQQMIRLQRHRLSQGPGDSHSRNRQPDRDLAGGCLGVFRYQRGGPHHHPHGRARRARRTGLPGSSRKRGIPRRSSLSMRAARDPGGPLQRGCPEHGVGGIDHLEDHGLFRQSDRPQPAMWCEDMTRWDRGEFYQVQTKC